MVYKIINSKYRVFIETLILSVLILFVGILIGYYIETARVGEIVDDSRSFEIEALDLKLQNYYFQIMDDFSCTEAITQNFIMADDLYNRGLVLERYEETNQITDEVLREKRRYVLLKTELWLNSILLKKKCGQDNFDTIVYIYADTDQSNVKQAEQTALANVLRELKEEKGNKIILLPIAGDLGLQSVELQERVYNITYLPSLIINERYILEGYHLEEDIEKLLVFISNETSNESSSACIQKILPNAKYEIPE